MASRLLHFRYPGAVTELANKKRRRVVKSRHRSLLSGWWQSSENSSLFS